MIKGYERKYILEQGYIFIENINIGFNKYKNLCFSGEYEKLEKFLLKIIKDSDRGIFDFYYSNLSEKDKQNFLKLIEFNKIMDKFDFKKDEIYFDINEVDTEILKFIIKISFDEILFSTFYFLNPKISIWTNYNKQIVLFFLEEKDFVKYKTFGIKQELDLVF